MQKLVAIALMFIALDLFGHNATASPGESQDCDALPCTEKILFDIHYSVCKALIPGYEVDEKKVGDTGTNNPPSSFSLLMSRRIAAAYGYPTSYSKNSPYVQKYTPVIITIRVENGQLFA